MAVDPRLLRGEAEANEENIGRGGAKLGKHGIVFLAIAIKIAVMGVTDGQMRKCLFAFCCRPIGDTGLRTEQSD